MRALLCALRFSSRTGRSTANLRCTHLTFSSLEERNAPNDLKFACHILSFAYLYAGLHTESALDLLNAEQAVVVELRRTTSPLRLLVVLRRCEFVFWSVESARHLVVTPPTVTFVYPIRPDLSYRTFWVSRILWKPVKSTSTFSYTPAMPEYQQSYLTDLLGRQRASVYEEWFPRCVVPVRQIRLIVNIPGL